VDDIEVGGGCWRVESEALFRFDLKTKQLFVRMLV